MTDLTSVDVGSTSIIILAVLALFTLIPFIGLGFLFHKANQPFIAAFIPFWNWHVLIIKLGKQTPALAWGVLFAPFALGIVSGIMSAFLDETTGMIFLLILAIISLIASILQLVVMIYALININKGFGRSKEVAIWTVFGVIFPVIWCFAVAWRGGYTPPIKATVFGAGSTMLTI